MSEAEKTDEKPGFLSSPFALTSGGWVASLVGLVASSDQTIRIIGAVGLIVLPLVYVVTNTILKANGRA